MKTQLIYLPPLMDEFRFGAAVSSPEQLDAIKRISRAHVIRNVVQCPVVVAEDSLMPKGSMPVLGDPSKSIA